MPNDPVDIDGLEIGARYRVDWKHERLRRTFRLVGTLVSIDEGSEDAAARVLTFEVKPRFGDPALQRVDGASVSAIRPA